MIKTAPICTLPYETGILYLLILVVVTSKRSNYKLNPIKFT